MRKPLLLVVSILLLVTMTSTTALAATNARRPAIIAGADEVVALQRTETDWEGTWYWYVGSSYNATNLTGVTALGLLEAYRDTKDSDYLAAAVNAANFIIEHLGVGATGIQHHVRTTAPDIIFLYRLSEVTGNPDYADRALLEWNNIKSLYPTAGDLDTLFKSINRPSIWDIAFFLEAAYLSGDMAWAEGAAAITANLSDGFYYNTGTWWYALNVAGAVRALVGCGYGGTYYTEIVELLNNLISLIDGENAVGGYVQDTAYAVLALNAIGGAANQHANNLGRWLARQQDSTGGWTESDGREYPEVDGEAVRALASTIGTNVTLDGFEPGVIKNSSWVRTLIGAPATAFSGE